MSAPKGLNVRANEAARLYAAGRTQVEIAQAFGVAKASISRLMRRHGIAVRRNYVPRGAAHFRWKGDSAGYNSLHGRVKTRLGTPRRCDVCGLDDPSRFYDWANLTGNYANPDDYARMCRSCHRTYDYSRWRGPGTLAAAEAAERLGIGHSKLCQLIREGRIAAQKAGDWRGAPYRITEQAIADYLAAKAVA